MTGLVQLATCIIAVAASSMHSCINQVLNDANVSNCLHVFEVDHEMLDILGVKMLYSLQELPNKLKPHYLHSFYTERYLIWDYDSMFLSVRNLSVLKGLLDFSSCTFRVREGAQVVVAFYGEAEELGKLFEMLWWCRYLNVVVVTRSIEVYTYHPVSLGNCTDLSFAPLPSCSAFKSKEQRTFPGCPLYIAGYFNRPFVNYGNFEENTGILVVILRIIVKALEFNSVFTCYYCDDKLPERVPHIDLDLVQLVLNYFMMFNKDPVYFPIQDELSFYLPPPKPLEPWRNIFHIFDWGTWTALILSVVLLGLYLKRNFILVISILFGNTCSNTHRRLPLLWECAAVILTSAYSGLLVSFLCKSIIVHDISTFEDLLESKYEICGSYFNRISVDYYKRYQQCQALDCQDCFDKLHEGTHAFLSDKHKLAYFTSLSDYRQWQKVWPQNNKHTFWYIVYNRKRSPFTKHIKKYMTRMHESGLTKKFVVDEMSGGKYGLSSVNSVALNHLYFIFVVYAIGILFAGIVLIGEIFLPPK